MASIMIKTEYINYKLNGSLGEIPGECTNTHTSPLFIDLDDLQIYRLSH